MFVWKNSLKGYGWIAIALHWLTVIGVFSLFGLGLYMVNLGYYDVWYHRGPWIHKSIGIILFVVVMIRLAWKLFSVKPKPLGRNLWLNRCIECLHGFLYLLLLLISLSGYFITAANGDPISVFDWISIPGITLGIENQEDVAGTLHEVFAWLLMVLVFFHVAGAIKHHLWDKDGTLKRMLRPQV